jgi:hypothetical protein
MFTFFIIFMEQELQCTIKPMMKHMYIFEGMCVNVLKNLNI